MPVHCCFADIKMHIGPQVQVTSPQKVAPVRWGRILHHSHGLRLLFREMVYPNIGVKNQSFTRKFYDICIIRVIGGNNSISGACQRLCKCAVVKARCPCSWRKQNYRKCSGVPSSTVTQIATGLQLEGFECPIRYGTGEVRILNGGRYWGRVVDSTGLPSALFP